MQIYYNFNNIKIELQKINVKQLTINFNQFDI